jgi:hypothetical protein
MAEDLKTLSEDIDKMVANKNEKSPHMSPRSIRPQTTIYKNVEDAKKAQENPEFDFVENRIKEILR